MPFTIIRQDITKMKVDAIVNAANTELLMGGGVCGAIFQAAGADELQAACNWLAPIRTGEAALTPGFHLPAKYVIHAAGPVYNQNNITENRRLLKSAYTESLVLARKNDCESIAFPLISSGIYGYPKREALRVAVSAIREFLAENDMDIYLAVFDKDALSAGTELQESITQYIDEYYVDLHSVRRRELPEPEARAIQAATAQKCPDFLRADKPADGLDDLIDHLDEPISTTILNLIDAKGMSDTEVYKRANIDRRLFSKIRSGKGYLPGKHTILALAIAMELTLDETDDLLKRAGYALSHSQKFDVIVEFFIVNGIYDIFQINEVLFSYDQPLLGANIDAVQTAGQMGICPDRTADYLRDSKGTRLNFQMMGEAVAEFRVAGSVPEECLDAIREDVKKRR